MTLRGYSRLRPYRPADEDEFLYYVLMAEPDRYLDEDGEPGDYEEAEKFDQPLTGYLAHVQKHFPQARWVGPCRAGERP